MANLDAPNGFVPKRHLKGGLVRAEEYDIASGYATDLFYGDVVKSVGSGRTIEQAADDAAVLGVFLGCHYTAANGDVVWSPRWVASTATKGAAPAKAFVIADPDVLYSVQIATIAAADVGTLADIVVAAGDAATGVSRFEAILAGDQFKILGLDDGSEYGAEARVLGYFVNHELAGAAAGVAV